MTTSHPLRRTKWTRWRQKRLPAPAMMKVMKKTTLWPITIYTVYLNGSMSEGPYVSYLNTQIATINDELNIKTLLNFYRLFRRYFRTCCQQTSTRERQHKTRINWINPQQLVVDVGEWVVQKKKGAKKACPMQGPNKYPVTFHFWSIKNVSLSPIQTGLFWPSEKAGKGHSWKRH